MIAFAFGNCCVRNLECSTTLAGLVEPLALIVAVTCIAYNPMQMLR